MMTAVDCNEHWVDCKLSLKIYWNAIEHRVFEVVEQSVCTMNDWEVCAAVDFNFLLKRLDFQEAF